MEENNELLPNVSASTGLHTPLWDRFSHKDKRPQPHFLSIPKLPCSKAAQTVVAVFARSDTMDHYSQSQQIGIGISFLILPVIAVSARLWAKTLGRKGIMLDDYLIIAALVSDPKKLVYEC